MVGPILDSIGAITDKAEELLAKLSTVTPPPYTAEPSSDETKIHRDLHVNTRSSFTVQSMGS